MPLDPIQLSGPPDSFKVAGGKINANKQYLEDKIDTETSNRITDTESCIKLDVNTTVTVPVVYGATHVDATASVTPDFNSGSPNFHFTNTGALTINNPTNIQSGEMQDGFIVTDTDDITWGSYFNFADDTLAPASEFYWFNYYVISDTSIAVILIQQTT